MVIDTNQFIDNRGVGLYLGSSAATVATGTHNSFLRNGAGILDSASLGSIFEGNNFVGNRFGVINNGLSTDPQLDAANSWWGDTKGPRCQVGCDGTSTGDSVIARVLFVPAAAAPITSSTPAPTVHNLADCILGATGDDAITRGFYIEKFPGTSLDRVQLFMSATIAGSYTFELEGRFATYDGPLLPSVSQTTVMLDGTTTQRLLTEFNYTSIPVAQGSTVTFVVNQLAGPVESMAFYAVPTTNAACPVVQTIDTAPPLSTFRRNGIEIRMLGGRP